MRAYIAGPFGERERLKECRERVRKWYPHTTCAWMDMPDGIVDERALEIEAKRDLAEIRSSDLVIVDNASGAGRGTLVELGYALSITKLYEEPDVWIIVGQQPQPYPVFYYLADRLFRTWDEVYSSLEEKHHEDHPAFDRRDPGPGVWVPDPFDPGDPDPGDVNEPHER